MQLGDLGGGRVPGLGGLDALEDERARHLLAPLLPVVRRLLVDAAVEGDLVVAVTAAAGCLLGVEAARVRGAGPTASTSRAARGGTRPRPAPTAPALALALDAGVRVHAAEHWARPVQPFSCSAAPVHDPRTGVLLGALDVTRDGRAATATALALVRATALAVEGELLVRALAGDARRRGRPAGLAGSRRGNLSGCSGHGSGPGSVARRSAGCWCACRAAGHAGGVTRAEPASPAPDGSLGGAAEVHAAEVDAAEDDPTTRMESTDEALARRSPAQPRDDTDTGEQGQSDSTHGGAVGAGVEPDDAVEGAAALAAARRDA